MRDLKNKIACDVRPNSCRILRYEKFSSAYALFCLFSFLGYDPFSRAFISSSSPTNGKGVWHSLSGEEKTGVLQRSHVYIPSELGFTTY